MFHKFLIVPHSAVYFTHKLNSLCRKSVIVVHELCNKIDWGFFSYELTIFNRIGSLLDIF